MIDITVMNGKNSYKGVKCAGHAGFDEYGKDVVCAAVSMLVINTINSIDELTATDVKLIEADSSDGILEVSFPNETESGATLLIDTMILGVRNVIRKYGEEFVRLKIS